MNFYQTLIAIIVLFQNACANPKFVRPASITSLRKTLPTSNFLLPAEELKRRQVTADDQTCGFFNGDANSPRTANSGFNCRVDTKNALWGFCPTSVISAIDCGLAGFCQDSSFCKDGCGLSDREDITSFACGTTGFCSTVLLTAGPDQTYSYIACGAHATTEHLLAAPTTTKQNTPSSSPAQPTSTPPTTPPSSPVSSQSKPSLSSSTSRVVSSITISSSDTTLNPSANSSNQASSKNSGSRASNPNIGPIVGGVIGGLGLILIAVLGFLFLGKYKRNHQSASLSQLPVEGGRTMPPAQTTGLHELYVPRDEKGRRGTVEAGRQSSPAELHA